MQSILSIISVTVQILIRPWPNLQCLDGKVKTATGACNDKQTFIS